MTPLIPFGKDTKEAIFSSLEILNPILTRLSGLNKRLTLDLSQPESGYAISIQGDKASIVFSYAMDDDQDATNGRLILKDRFELKVSNKKLLSFGREVTALGNENFWKDAASRLNRSRAFNIHQKPIKNFFTQVVAKLDLPRPVEEELQPLEEAPAEKLDRRGLDPLDSLNVSAAAMRNMLKWLSKTRARKIVSPSFQHHPHVEKTNQTLLRRRFAVNTLTSVQQLLDFQLMNYVSTATSPEMIVCLFGGSAGFQLGRAWGASFQHSSLAASRAFSTATGLVVEAPAFELSARMMNAIEGKEVSGEGFFAALPRHYLTFGAFRGAALLNRSALGSFAALHGINEFERNYGLRPGAEEDYIRRFMEDAVLFSQLSVASHLSEVILVPSLGGQHAVSERLSETKIATYGRVRALRDQAEVWVRRGIMNEAGHEVFSREYRPSFLNPQKLVWRLGSADKENAFYPEVMATHENSPRLEVFKDDLSRYFIRREAGVPQPEARIEYFDSSSKQWKPIGSEPFLLVQGLRIRAGEHAIYQFNFKNPFSEPLVSVVEPRQNAAPSVSLPLAFLPKLTADAPILATQLPDVNGVHLRELRDHRQIQGVGEVSSFTIIGRDKKVLRGKRTQGVNEDAIGLTLDAHGNPVFVVADGVGSTSGGELASALAVEGMVSGVRARENRNLGDITFQLDAQIRNETPGETVLGALRIFPDGSVEHASIGDIRLWIIRNMPDGSRRIYEPRLPHTQSANLFNRGGIASTLAFNVHPWTHVTLAALGGKERQLKVVDELNLKEGDQIFHQQRLRINEGSRQNPEWKELKLQEGDELLLLGDGVAGLMDEAQLLRLASSQVPLSENLNALHDYTLQAFKLYDWARNEKNPEAETSEIPSGYLFEGNFIARDGKIYKAESPRIENLMGYVAPDNASVIWFRYNPTHREATLKPTATPGLPPSVELPLNVPRPPSDPVKKIPAAPAQPLAPLRVSYQGKWSEVRALPSGEFQVGSQHQAEIFAKSPWVQSSHFKLEPVQDQGIWKYRLTVLADSNLWVENHLPKPHKFFKICEPGESYLLSPGSHEFNFKKSAEEWGEALFVNLPEFSF